MTVSIIDSSITVTFSGGRLANGEDLALITVLLQDDQGSPIVGEEVRLSISPVDPTDVVTYGSGDHSITDPAGTATVTFSTEYASIKLIEVLLGTAKLKLNGLMAKPEFLHSDLRHLVNDPINNTTTLASTNSLVGKRMTVRAELGNAGAITEVLWDGIQVLNTKTKDRALQPTYLVDNFDTVKWARLNQGGALSEAWGASSSSKYVADVTNSKELISQSYMAYHEPITYNSTLLSCSGNLLSSQFYIDFLGNPSILKMGTRLDQYTSTKRGALHWAMNLSGTQDFTNVYTYRPDTDGAPVSVLASSVMGELITAYPGGVIVANSFGTLAMGLYRQPLIEGHTFKTIVVKPVGVEAGDPKFTDNYCQVVDIESSPAGVGSAAGSHHAERYLCVGSLLEVQLAFDELSEYFGLGTVASTGATSITVQSIPTTVQVLETFNILVTAVDSSGALVTDYNKPITVSIPASQGLLGGLTTQLALNGTAVFRNLTHDTAGFKQLLFQSDLITGTAQMTVESRLPILISIDPAEAPDSRTTEMEVTLTGSNFEPDSVGFFSETPLETTYVSPSTLRVILPSNLFTFGRYPVKVFGAPPGGGFSNNILFTVTDGTGPVIFNVDLQTNSTGLNLGWETDEPATSDFRYIYNGATTINEDLTLKRIHNLTLDNLASGEYSSIIRGRDLIGNLGTGSPIRFTIGDTTPPVIGSILISNVSASSATVDWTTNESTTYLLEYTANGVTMSTSSSVSGLAHTVVLTGLTASTTYSVTVHAQNAAGLPAQKSELFTTNEDDDVTPPNILSGPNALGTTQISTSILWVTDEDATSGVRFGTQPGQYGPLVSVPGRRTSHTVSITGLQPLTLYYYKVEGADEAGNPYASGENTFSTTEFTTQGNLNAGDILVSLDLKIPKGKTAGDQYFCHASIPIVNSGDLALNWEVDGTVVQRKIVTYKPKPQVITSGSDVFVEEDGIVAVEFENIFDASSAWVSHTAITGFTGSSYIEWEGANHFNNPGVGTFGFDVEVSNPGDYTLAIRNQHDNPDPTEENDVWVRMDGGTWVKVFSNGPNTNQWNWETRSESSPLPSLEIVYNLTEGTHTIEFSGRSFGFRMDRVHLSKEDNPNKNNENFPQSTRLGAGDPDSGPNSVEIIFLVEVPPGVTAGDTITKELAATSAPTPASLSLAIPTGFNMALTMPNRVDQVCDLLDPTNVKVVKQGHHCSDVRFFKRLTDGVDETLCVHVYVTQYDPAIDSTVYVRLLISNSFIDPTNPGTDLAYQSTGKIYFDELIVDSSGTGMEVMPRLLKNCMEQVSATNLKVVAFTTEPNKTLYHFARDVDKNGNPVEPTPENRSFGGVRQEIFPNQFARIEHMLLHVVGAPSNTVDYSRDVLEYQNVAKASSGRNSLQNVRWFGPCYMRSGNLPDSYLGTYEYRFDPGYIPDNPRTDDSPSIPIIQYGINDPNVPVGNLGYDLMRQSSMGEWMKFIMTHNFVQFDGGMGRANIIPSNWRPVHEFGCWSPGFSRKGSEGGTYLMNVYEMGVGPGHSKAWTFWYDQVIERHWTTQFHGNGDHVTNRDWRRPDGQLTFAVYNNTGIASVGLEPFWGHSGAKHVPTQTRLFNYDSNSRCDYDDPNNLFSFWGAYSPISNTHIQRLLRCFWGLTAGVIYSQLYMDMFTSEAEIFLMSEDRHTYENINLNPSGGPNRVGTLGQLIPELATPDTQGRGVWNADFGRAKAWPMFLLAMYNMFLDPNEAYADGLNKRQNLQEHFKAEHELFLRAMPGGNVPTWPAGQATNRRMIQTDIGTDSGFESSKEDCPSVLYSYGGNLDGPFTLRNQVITQMRTRFANGGDLGPYGGRRSVTFVRPDQASEQTGQIGVFHGTSSPYPVGSIIEHYDPSDVLDDNGNVIIPANQTQNTFTITQFIDHWGLKYRFYQQMEMYIQVHGWYAVSKLLAATDTAKSRDFAMWTYEHVLAQSEHPEYYATTEYTQLGSEFRSSGGYNAYGANGDRSQGFVPTLVNEFFEEEPVQPFMLLYNGDIQNTHCWYPHVCAAYAATDLGIDPEVSLSSMGILEGWKIGVGWDTPAGDWEQRISEFGNWSFRGSTANVNERWHNFAPWVGEVQYQLNKVPDGTVGIGWGIASTTVFEGSGLTEQLKVRTVNSGTATEPVVFTISLGGTAPPEDYDISPGPYTLTPGQTFLVIPTIINGDSIITGNRTIELTIGLVSGPATLTTQDTLVVTIIESTGATTPLIQFDTGSQGVFEGAGPKSMRVVTTTAPAADTVIRLSRGGSASTPADFSIQGLQSVGSNNYELILAAGQTVAQFSITANQDNIEDAGEDVIFNILDDPSYFVGIQRISSITIGELAGGGETEIVWEGLGTADGAPGAGIPNDNQLVVVMVPLLPPVPNLPKYYMIGPDQPTVKRKCQVNGVTRDADGNWTSAQVCTTIFHPSRRWSIPGDVNNPAIILGQGDENAVPAVAYPNNIPLSANEVIIKLANVSEPFILRPDVGDGTWGAFGPSVETLSGIVFRRRIYSGTCILPSTAGSNNRSRDESCLVVKLSVDQRPDVRAWSCVMVIENSALDSSGNPKTVDLGSDGDIHFEYIKYKVNNGFSRIVGTDTRPTLGPVAGTSDTEYYMVKPQDDVAGQGTNQEHVIGPGRTMIRRFSILHTSVTDQDIVRQILSGRSWGYVDGGLGYSFGGYGEASIALPNFSKLTSASYGGETGVKAFVAHSIDVNQSAKDDLDSGTIVPGQTHWGWAKPGGPANPEEASVARFNPLGFKSCMFRSLETTAIDFDRMVERGGHAAFNLNTKAGLTEEDLILASSSFGGATDRLPYGFTSYGTNFGQIVAWNSTDSGSWGLAPTDLPWNNSSPGKTTAYHTPGKMDWQADTQGSYGPFTATSSSYLTDLIRARIWLFNDPGAIWTLEYEAKARMFAHSRYLEEIGTASNTRYNVSHDLTNLKHMEDTENNRGTLPLNQGFYYSRDSNPVTSVHGAAKMANAFGAVAMWYTVAPNSERIRINDNNSGVPATTRSWPVLASRFVDRLVNDTGIIASTDRDLPGNLVYGNGTTNPDLFTRTGPLPGTNNNPGALYYSYSRGDEMANATQIALTFPQVFGLPSVEQLAFERMLKWADIWGEASGSFVQPDPLNGGQGTWMSPLGVVASVGSSGLSNAPMSEAAARAGEAVWNFESINSEAERATGSYMMAAAGYAQSSTSFDLTADGIRRSLSIDGVNDIATLAESEARFSSYFLNVTPNHTAYLMAPLVGQMHRQSWGL